jgi:hypothetical protein
MIEMTWRGNAYQETGVDQYFGVVDGPSLGSVKGSIHGVL